MGLWWIGHALTQGIGLSGLLTYTVVEDLHGGVTPLFRTPCGHIRRGFEKTHQTMGRPEIKIHDLRRAYISWLAAPLDAPLTTIRDKLGLYNLSVTYRCVHLWGSHFATASEALWGTNVLVTS